MSTTTNRPTPATATTLHAMLDDMLSPTRASTPEPAAVAQPGNGTSVLDDIQGVLDKSGAARRVLAARRAAPPTVLRESQSFNTELYEGYGYDPMPTSDDALGMRERMDELGAAIAARVARSDPRPAPATPAMSSLTEARLTRAYRRIDEILG